MAIKQAKTAIRRHLSLLPKLPTAYEGVSFVAPENGLYQRLQFVINPPTDPTFGNYYYRENITAQIFVLDKLDKGTDAAEVRAEIIRDHFHKGLTLVEGDIRLSILRTPHVSSAATTADRLIVPVLIPFTVEVVKSV